MRKTIQYITILLVTCAFTFNVTHAQNNQAKYQLPPYEKFQLPNGMTVYLMEKHTVPVISISAIISAGAVYDGNKAGLASLTAECLKCGTKSYTKNEIEQTFDFAGASFNTYGAKEFAGLSARLAVKDENKLLPIIKEMLVEPVFNNEDFTKEKKRTLVNLDQAKESPGSVINLYWDKFFYGNHVYGNVVTGTVSSVTPFTSNDLKDFYKTHYNPEGSAIAVVGDFNTNEMKAKLTKLFSDWKKTTTSTNNLAAQLVAEPTAAKVLLVNKEDARETTFLIGSKGVSRNNPDYLVIQVVNTVFGGRFTSWINDELRIKSGLTYGAGSYFSALKTNGAFLISTHTANETTEPTIAKALEVLNRLHTQGIDEETLTSAKNYMIGLFPPRFQTTDQLAGLLTGMFWYGFDESYINNFETNVNAVTVAKAKEISDKYFPKDKLQFVLIGKSADIKKIAEKYGPVTEVQIKDDVGKGF
ncbi:MAG: pitrilysin family protein [Parafilimonas sp.]